ncbi:uncharacterized protein LOC130999531 [Salvia miltiorrhiza]|uniref:uncharacterized protein LOC130999531 n=1 Tax=Salvia miltiorrhiza TaxID=226208 RepID=UPI0025AD07F5|nr:uncharacterized protein LOC130999531 [Salvia miltiorrhiza]
MNPHSMTPEAAAQFGDGIHLVLSRWAALRMVIENEWGGRDTLQKSQQLRHNLFNFLTQSKAQVYIDDVEDILFEFMDSLNTEIEDGSVEEVSEKLMVMREECLEGKFDSIKKLRETDAPSISYTRQANSDDEEDSDEDDDDNATMENNSSAMEVDAPHPQPQRQCQLSLGRKDAVADETGTKDASEVVDGWTVVSSRRSKGRKN